ncbi:reverse gyrase [Vulcanisaeta moutnovskia 768-28]|uniref:Reverse gyrase n=1 Tax=Vulcanisaeta moutnovskia (strain 768-28) TaxID=985053 RepID=F0QVK1_VULM7|nr:reverse gyrase [Vulcanisaeta moutnovskia]ADY00854.1 reverse gyrase [Vulcanisaeta moutnovskia 768-28]
MEKQPIVIYRKACPNCGGDITSDRLGAGLPCYKCLPEVAKKVANTIEVLNTLEKLGTINRLKSLSNLINEYNEFMNMFKKVVGTNMWGAQRLWTRRLIKGKSFAIVAPTGSGKTTFGMMASLYIALRKRSKVLIVVPTSTLAYDVHRRLSEYSGKMNSNIRIIMASSILYKQELIDAMNAIENGDFDILIITNAFLPRHMDLLRKYRFSLIFVDDVDSVLKASSKNIDRLLLLLGINEEALHKALTVVDLMKKLRKAIRFRASDEEINKLKEDIKKLSTELSNYVKSNNIGILIASGALTRIRRTARLFLFREFLGFETGGRAEGLRNVVDAYTRPKDSLVSAAVEIVKRLGGGGIIYVPPDLREIIDELSEKLNNNGIKAAAYLKPSKSLLNDFVDGKIDVLIGLATSRSSLVRGIDLPQRIAYVVFVGVPRMKFRIKLEEFTPMRYLMFLFNIRNIVPQYLRNDVDRVIARLRNLTALNQEQVNNLLMAIEENRELSGFDKYAADVIKDAVDLVNKLLSDPGIRRAIEQSNEVGLEYRGNDLYVIIPDLTTYIQGSGRTSRLYVGGVSLGLSVLIVDNEKVFNGLVRNLRYRLEDVKVQDINEINIDELMKKIRNERELIRNIMLGRIPNQFLEKDPLRTAFVIVESPTKARTIANFFGVPTRRETGPLVIYEATLGNLYLLITATKGHMWDLIPAAPADVKSFSSFLRSEKLLDYYGILRAGNNFVPIYGTIKRCPVGGETYTEDINVCKIHGAELIDAMDIVNAVRDIATEVDQVMIGTDPDAEGEKIAWDVYMMLRPYVGNIARIEFHEVTKKAIIDAIMNPRTISLSMVGAQLVRRIEDRWIGFGLSQIVQEKFGRRTLSAGRVQTPVLGWIIERYDESRKDKIYTVTMTLSNGIKIRLGIPPDKEELVKTLKALHRNKAVDAVIKVAVTKVGETEEELNPPPPYTTDALLRDSANILGLSVEQTMAIAQELFESGLITYHRTDSTRVSSVGIGIAKEYISEKVSSDYFVGRTWGGKEIGAHECIRPTRPIDSDDLRNLLNTGLLQLAIKVTANHLRVYDLIFKRFIASQMKSAKVMKEKLRISVYFNGVDTHDEEIERISKILEPGFTRFWGYLEGKEYQELTPGEYNVTSIDYIKKVSRTLPLREGDIIAMMKERGIGRPSTYAKIVDVILKRRYALVVGRRTRYVVPTNLGRQVYKFLTEDNKEFSDLVSEERTRMVEKHMDDVEVGERDYMDVLNELFNEAISKGILKENVIS